MTPAPGDVLAGKYRVERVLGEGGMGVVLAATHLQFETLVAIKLLHPEIARASSEVLQRFKTEARAVVRLKSEHVGRVMDVGELETGEPFLVMEYLEGSDLAGVLAERGALPVREAVDLLLQACDGVAAAHAQGIVHRDLKPANLFVATGSDGLPCVKVLDFGIAKAGAGTSGFNMTTTATVMGTPLYMSPEQMRSSRDADARSDVWSLGIILYQMLAGEVPFLGETMPELVLAVVQKPVPVIRRPEVTRDLMQVIDTCLAKEPAARIQTVGALARALAPFGDEDAPKTAMRISRVLGEGSVSGPGIPRRQPSLPDAGLATLPAQVGMLRDAGVGRIAPAPIQPAPVGGSTDLAMGALTPTRMSPGATSSRLPLFIVMGVLAVLGVFGVGYLKTRGDRGGVLVGPGERANIGTTPASMSNPPSGDATTTAGSTANSPATATQAATGVVPTAGAAEPPVVPASAIVSLSPSSSAKATQGASPASPSTAAPAKTSKSNGGSSSNNGFGDRQ